MSKKAEEIFIKVNSSKWILWMKFEQSVENLEAVSADILNSVNVDNTLTDTEGPYGGTTGVIAKGTDD